MKLIFMLSAFPLTILIIGIAGIVLYKKNIQQKSWFKTLTFHFRSLECPHIKDIPYSESSSLFLKRREKKIETNVFSKHKVTREVWYRLFCETCHKKRSFNLIDTPELGAFRKYKTLYLFGTFGAIFLAYGVIIAPILTFIFKVFNL